MGQLPTVRYASQLHGDDARLDARFEARTAVHADGTDAEPAKLAAVQLA